MQRRIVKLLAALALTAVAWAQPLDLKCDPQQTTSKWVLPDALHTVRGDFKVKRCQLHFDSASSKMEGEVVFDATSGQSGNSGRDAKMHKDVLESARYPEILFRPDHVEGAVAPQGESTVKVHGQFTIHGAAHEVLIPVTVKLTAGAWSATAHFPVPYVKWGMKDPSILFLRVGDTVDIDFSGAGPAL